MASFLPFYENENSQSEEQESCFPTLTYKERIIGFAVCFVLGYIFSFLKKFLFIFRYNHRNNFFRIVYSGSYRETNKIRHLLQFRKYININRVISNNFMYNENIIYIAQGSLSASKNNWKIWQIKPDFLQVLFLLVLSL